MLVCLSKTAIKNMLHTWTDSVDPVYSRSKQQTVTSFTGMK